MKVSVTYDSISLDGSNKQQWNYVNIWLKNLPLDHTAELLILSNGLCIIRRPGRVLGI